MLNHNHFNNLLLALSYSGMHDDLNLNDFLKEISSRSLSGRISSLRLISFAKFKKGED